MLYKYQLPQTDPRDASLAVVLYTNAS